MAEIFVFLFLGTPRKIKLYHILYNIEQTNRMRNLPLILISTTIKVLHFVWKHKTWFGCCHYAHVLVSNIQFNTKSIERVVAQQFNNHFTANGLHYNDRIWTYTECKWLYSIGSLDTWFSLIFLHIWYHRSQPLSEMRRLFVCIFVWFFCLTWYIFTHLEMLLLSVKDQSLTYTWRQWP